MSPDQSVHVRMMKRTWLVVWLRKGAYCRRVNDIITLSCANKKLNYVSGVYRKAGNERASLSLVFFVFFRLVLQRQCLREWTDWPAPAVVLPLASVCRRNPPAPDRLFILTKIQHGHISAPLCCSRCCPFTAMYLARYQIFRRQTNAKKIERYV